MRHEARVLRRRNGDGLGIGGSAHAARAQRSTSRAAAALPDARDRLAGGKDGAALFSNLCGACHLAGGMGTNLLTKQRVMLGEAPERGLLENR